jgi:hypothetical protein
MLKGKRLLFFADPGKHLTPSGKKKVVVMKKA